MRFKNSATGRKHNTRKLGVFMPSWQKRICELRATFAPLRLKTRPQAANLITVNLVSSCLRGKKKRCELRATFAPLRLKNSATGRKLNTRKLGVFMPSWQKKKHRTSRNLLTV
ncbi:hypothetical protein, partial [Flavobacterium sp.]|uniref:hypothetical protein n=1 Tax=Flavobacterium sp. TaxID=239 RepID=UPI00391997F7